MLIKLLRPTSLAFNNNTESIRLQTGVGSDSKWVPLQLRNARHIHGHYASGFIIQSWGKVQIMRNVRKT